MEHRRAELVRVELENFRSYVKPVSLEWREFSLIVGTNGAGKSSIINAMEFAFFYPPYDKISVSDLKKTVCNQISDCSSSRVQVTFKQNGKETVFQRSACFIELNYKLSINGIDVNAKEYKKSLLEYNINCTANNFLIKENSIENIALVSAKERCDFFERMSNSIAYKREYNRLSKELEAANAEAMKAKKDLNFYAQQRKKIQKTSKDAKKYDELQNELEKIELDYYLAKLYRIDKTVEKLLQDQNKPKTTIKVIEKMKIETEDSIAGLKNELKEHEARLDELNAESDESASKVANYNQKKLELEQNRANCENNIKKLEMNLENARKIYESRKQTLKDLKDQYQQVEKEKENYVNSHSMSCSLKLEDNQYEEYLQLKSIAQQQCAREIGLFNSIGRERDAIRDKLDDYEMRKKFLSEQIEKGNEQSNELRSKIEQINRKIKETKKAEQDCKIENDSFKQELQKLMKEIEFLTTDINKLDNEIVDSKELEREDKKSKQKQEILGRLKSHFPGVYDRVVNLFEIEEEQYEVAITKLMGNKMDNIVVNNTDTARNCIRYLKEQYANCEFSAVETFLPLDNLKTKSLDKAVRCIQDNPKAKLATEVMVIDIYHPEGIRTALHHILGDAVICETDDQASQLSLKTKLSCVSWNGTFYKKDGTFSGGLASLLEKSKKWKSSKMKKQKETREELKQEKQKKYIRLRELRNNFREIEEAVCKTNVKVQGLQERVQNYLEPIKRGQKEALENKEKELLKLKNDFEKLTTDPEIKELKKKLYDIDIAIEKIEEEKNKIEDQVFDQFCQKFNINNIRQYEQQDFRKQKERSDRIKDFENHLNRIKNQYDYEKSRDTKTRIKQLQDELNNRKELCQELKEQQDQLEKLINDSKINQTKQDELKSEKRIIETIKKKLKLEQNKYNAMNRDLKESNSTLASIKANVLNLIAEKHELLQTCKVKSINIPLLKGTIDKVELKSRVEIETESTENSSEQSSDNDSQIKEKNIDIDYKQLENTVKTLDEYDMKNHIDSLKRKVDILRDELEKLYIDAKLKEGLKKIEESRIALQKDYNEKRDTAASIKQKFEKVRNERQDIFNKFFNSVAVKINKIFKDLYGNEAAQAQINMTNADESYLGGINFNCIIPKKGFKPIESLSGGEKAMCALALILSIYSVKPAPFLVFDEIDAALDTSSRNRILSYFNLLRSSTQIIIISHHNVNYFRPDAIIGINIATDTQSSYAVHIDGTQYQEENDFEERMSTEKLHSAQSAQRVIFLPEISSTESAKSLRID